MGDKNNILFGKYAKRNSKESKVLMMYLILNGYDKSKVTRLEDSQEDAKFGDLKYRKIYGITEEFVDTKQIEEELEAIKIPIVYSPTTFGMHAKSKTLHVYSAKSEDRPMVINDLGIISTEMVITRDLVISSNPAKEDKDIPIYLKGFMFFMDYVLKEELYIGQWHIVYKDKCFEVDYISNYNTPLEKEDPLYMAIEIDKTSTYRLVIYIIQKVCESLDEWKSDNFIDEIYDLRISQN